jgi:predicted RecB family nuclease
MTRSGLALSHATRVLEALGHGDASARAGIIDRRGQLWWLELGSNAHPRFNLKAYERHYQRRHHVLLAHEQWQEFRDVYPTTPYWHRDCLECPYNNTCRQQLEEVDDVSLIRFTTIDQQRLLREHGLDTREKLARLDPYLAHQAGAKMLNPRTSLEPEQYLAQTIDKLDELIYRARAYVHGTPLRTLSREETQCPTADVEVDVDMESYANATYLWGAFVSVNLTTEGVEAGYHAFVDWNHLSPDIEATNFALFWRWLSTVRRSCNEQNRSFSAYCFWSHAENSAMERAVRTPLLDGPTMADLKEFREKPGQWIDLHSVAKQQIQTEGPLGLKLLATTAGFQWRDPNPSGEASMFWYEESVRPDSPTAHEARTRILEYNEDDCRATKALRDWLNGPARELPHRDDPL